MSKAWQEMAPTSDVPFISFSDVPPEPPGYRVFVAGSLEALEDLETLGGPVSCGIFLCSDSGRLKFRRLRQLSLRKWRPRDHGG